MTTKITLLAIISFTGTLYTGYSLWDALILFNIAVIVGITGEFLYSRKDTGIDLSKPFKEIELDLKENNIIKYKRQNSIFIFYHISHFPQINFYKKLCNHVDSQIQIIELEDSVFLGLRISIPKKNCEVDAFIKENERKFLRNMKQLIPGIVLVPITTEQLLWIYGKFPFYAVEATMTAHARL